MKTRLLILMLLLALAGVTGCPGGSGYDSASRQAEPRGSVEAAANGNVHVDIDAASIRQNALPRPKGKTWVYVPKEEYYQGEDAQIEVSYEPMEDSKVWLEVLPTNYRQYDYNSRIRDGWSADRYYLDEYNKPIQLKLPYLGSYLLRLVADSGRGPYVVAESQTITVRQIPVSYASRDAYPELNIWSDGNRSSWRTGHQVGGHYRLPRDYGDGAWIGLVRVDEHDRLLDNIVYVVTRLADRDDDFYWVPTDPGRYRLRIYDDPSSTLRYVAETAAFDIGGEHQRGVRGLDVFDNSGWAVPEGKGLGGEWRSDQGKGHSKKAAGAKSLGSKAGKVHHGKSQAKAKAKGGGKGHGSGKGHGKGDGHGKGNGQGKGGGHKK